MRRVQVWDKPEGSERMAAGEEAELLRVRSGEQVLPCSLFSMWRWSASLAVLCELKLHEGDRVKEIVTFSRCRQQDTRVVFLVADSVHQKTDNPGRSVEQDEHLGSLLCIKSKDRPGEVPGLSNMLGDL